jgi:hypothetical protein
VFKHAAGIFKHFTMVFLLTSTVYGGERGIWSFVSLSLAAEPRTPSAAAFSPSFQIPVFKHAAVIFKLFTIVFILTSTVYGGERGIWSFVSLPLAAEPRTPSAFAFSPSIQIPLFKHATGIFKLSITVLP